MNQSPGRTSARSNRNAPMPADPVEDVLARLRKEWTQGFPAENGFLIAVSQIKRLRARAAAMEATRELDRIETALAEYRLLAREQRGDLLLTIANGLKALKPLLADLPPVIPTGVLESAIAPSRAAAKATAAPPKPRPRVEAAMPAVLKPSDPVTRLPRTGDAQAKKLVKLGLVTVEDVLRFAPRRHIDYSHTMRIGDVLLQPIGSEVTVRGQITDLQLIKAGQPRVVIKLADQTGWVRVTWFNQYLYHQMALGDEIAISGKLESGFAALNFTGPEWEHASGPKARGLNTGRLIPVYALTSGVTQNFLRPFTRAALDMTKAAIEDFLPDEARIFAVDEQRIPVPALADAYEMLHYPARAEDAVRARQRLMFDNLYLLQLGLLQRKLERQAADGIPIERNELLLEEFQRALPFRLTGDQQRSIDAILENMTDDKPMARLVQGDVGSGKTVVAAAAIHATVAAGFQTALMAPTQILAEQHERGLQTLFAALPEEQRPKIALLTGATNVATRRKLLAGVETGEINLLVGTHALIEGNVRFDRLALAVVDEQHRFGVRQRASLQEKAGDAQPHMLALTATPIPRSLNMVLHGDLDVSVIAERPPGRKPVHTRRFIGADREQAYHLVREEVAAGRQVFVICPLVEASEQTEAKAAVEEAERLQLDVFPDFRIATLHGRMSGKLKDEVMTGFRDRDFDILVATSVIEVGIDIPNATVMLIEGADRFGLAQLHQFRGRVGRGAEQSWCLLLADDATPQGEERLQMMVESDDGFLLAQKDLELRGPGDFIGARQSGLPDMGWEGGFDTRWLDKARQAAVATLDRDPELSLPEHAALRERLAAFWTKAGGGV